MRFGDYVTRDFEDDTPDDNIIGEMVVKHSSKDLQVIRECIIDEMETINNHIERAELCENDMVRVILLNMAEEERIHLTELERVLEAIEGGNKDVFGGIDEEDDEN